MNKIIYDWVSITSKIDSPHTMIARLGIKDAVWEEVKGAHGYRDRLYFNFISIHYNGRDDMGVWLEMSGQGCRAFETYGSGDYESLFSEVLDEPGSFNITRLDVAFDDHDGILNLGIICNDADCNYPDPGNFVSQLTEWNVRKGSKGATIEHGSMSSDVFIRIYDKARERGFVGDQWVRVELQLRDQRALGFIKQKEDIGTKYLGVLRNYLRYVEDPGTDSNTRRWPMTMYWSNLIGAVQRISIYEKPGVDYNLGNLESFVFKQAGNAISALLEIQGEEEFKKRLNQRGTHQNPKYKALIEQYGKREK